MFDSLCCIYPCVPFLTADILKAAYARFVAAGCDALTPVVRYAHPIQRALRINERGFLEYREPCYAASRTQDLEPMFHDAGMFYFLKAYVLERTDNRTLAYELDALHVQDIDTPADWKHAEMKYRLLQHV